MKVRASVDRRFGLPSLRGTCVTTQRRALWPKSSTPQISPSESVAWTEEERPRSVRNSISLCRSSNRQQVHRRHPVVCSIFGPQRFCRRLHAASFDASNASSAEDAAAQIYDLPSAKVWWCLTDHVAQPWCQVLVETSMLASVSGVCQLLLGILRLDAYMHYLLPFPLVLAAVRSGPAASRKTLVATFFLTIGIPCFISLFYHIALHSPARTPSCCHLCLALWIHWLDIGVPVAFEMSVVVNMDRMHALIRHRNDLLHLRRRLLTERESLQARHIQCLHTGGMRFLVIVLL